LSGFGETFVVGAAFDYRIKTKGPVDTSSDEIGDNEDERDDERDEEAQRDADTRERDERRRLDFARLELLA
jgi:hypothetical protein